MAYTNGNGMYGNGGGDGINAPNGFNTSSPTHAGRGPPNYLQIPVTGFQEPMRPSSSMSTASFASQIGGAPLPADYYGPSNGVHSAGMQASKSYGHSLAQNCGGPFADGDPYRTSSGIPRAPAQPGYGNFAPTPAMRPLVSMTPLMPTMPTLIPSAFNLNVNAGLKQAAHMPQQNGFAPQTVPAPYQNGFAHHQNFSAPQHNGSSLQQHSGHVNSDPFRHMRSDSAQGGPGHSLAQMICSGNTTDHQTIDQFDDTPAYVGDRRLSHALQPSTPQRNGGGVGRGYGTRYRGNSFQAWTAQQQPTNTSVGRPFAIATQSPPAWFNQVMNGYRPSLQEALSSLPFTNQLRDLQPSSHGVLKFLNIPYATTKNELLAVLGRNAQVAQMPVGTPYFAVHIIMDRNSGKTMDAFIEVSSAREALNVLTQVARRAQTGRTLKLGDRQVDVEISSQEELMKELFPRAKNVEWVGSTPRVIDEDTEYFSNVQALGFDGFVGSEEMVMLVKFAENPSRSPFTNRSPNRLYECIISTLHKYPWHRPEAVLLSDRKKIFDTALACIKTLMNALRRGQHEALRTTLLQELTVAALGCPGFSEQQKAQIVETMYTAGQGAMTVGHGMAVHLGGRHYLSAAWPFLALTKKPEACDPLLQYYADLISNASSDLSNMSLGQMAAAYSGGLSNDPFGALEIDYGTTNMARMSLAEVAQKEFDGIADILGGTLLTTAGRISYRTPSPSSDDKYE